MQLFLGRKCTYHHHLALKTQLSPLTVPGIAMGYVWALYSIHSLAFQLEVTAGNESALVDVLPVSAERL